MTNVRVVQCDDWVELYLDGNKLHAGHEIPQWMWIQLLTRVGVVVSVANVLPSYFTGSTKDDEGHW